MTPAAAKSEAFRRYVLGGLVGKGSYALFVFDSLHCAGTNLFEAAANSGGI